MKYYVAVFLFLAAILVPQIKADDDDMGGLIHRSLREVLVTLAETRTNLAEYVNSVEDGKKRYDRFVSHSRGLASKAGSDALQEIRMKNKDINNNTCEISMKADLDANQTDFNSYFFGCANRILFPADVPNMDKINLLYTKLNGLREDILAVSYNCYYRTGAFETVSCMGPKISAFQGYVAEYRLETYEVQVEIHKLFNEQATEAVQCTGILEEIEAAKKKALKCLEGTH